MTHGHFDIGRAPRLDSEGRLKELRPQQLLTEIGHLAAGMTGVDLGCGTGTFALPMAAIVGTRGTVYAVDDSPQMLDYLRAKNPPPQLKPVPADAANTGLDGAIADFCLLAFILHEVKSADTLLNEAFRLLKPGGRLLVAEWKAESESPGPPRNIRISRSQVEQLLQQAGFTHFEYADWSVNHYAVTAVR